MSPTRGDGKSGTPLASLQSGNYPLVGGNPDSIIAYRGSRAISRRRFMADVANAAAQLPNNRHVINVCNDRYLFLVGFAAALSRGQISLLPPSRVTGVVVAIAEDYGDCYLLADTHVGDGALPLFCLSVGAEPAAEPAERSTASDKSASDSPADVTVPQISLERTAAIVFTSGSTGKAAPNVKSWLSLVEGARINAAALLGLTQDEDPGQVNLVATVPQQHMYGLETTVMLPLLGACAAQCDRPFFPADVLAALERMPLPRILVTTPIHLRALAQTDPTPAALTPLADTARLRILPEVTEIWSATAPLNTELAAACERQFKAPLREILGSSETGTFATRLTAQGEPWQLLEGFSIASNAEGIEVDAPHLAQAVQLQDSVEMMGPRTFRLLGRTRDSINIAGKRASLGDLNARLLSIPGVRDGVIFLPPNAGDAASAVGDAEPAAGARAPRAAATSRTAALVVAPGMTSRQVLAALRELVDPAFLPRPLVLVDALPRNETSKLPRSALLALFAEHVNAS